MKPDFYTQCVLTVIAACLVWLLLSYERRNGSPTSERGEPYWQRFISAPKPPDNMTGVPWTGWLALDTETGQLCRTYNGKPSEDWQTLPLCSDLYVKPSLSSRKGPGSP